MTRRQTAITGLGIVLALIVVAGVVLQRDESATLLQKARTELRAGNPEGALQVLEPLLASHPATDNAVRIAAAAHAELGHFAQAATLFITQDDGARMARETLVKGAESHVASGRLLAAVELLEQCTELFPDDVAVHRRLAAILNAGGRRWDAMPHGRRCIEHNQFSVAELLLWGNPEEPYDAAKILPDAARLMPDDPMVMTGLSVSAARTHDLDRAIQLLRAATARQPRLLEAQALLGGFLFDQISPNQSDSAEFVAWNNSLPDSADTHPEIWIVRSRWAQSTDQLEAAARCSWEAVRLAPQNRRANYLLGQTLTELDRASDAAPFLKRAEELAALHELMRPIYFQAPTSQSLIGVAEAMDALGRNAEARAWYFAASRFSPGASPDAAAMSSPASSAASSGAKRSAREDIALPIDLSSLPLPQWTVTASPALARRSSQDAAWTFPDIAARIGIDFVYFNCDDPATEGKRMIETTGGGVAVLDLDHDGWPDLYLTQGCPWPVSGDLRLYPDHCYRNSGRGTFRECAADAGLIDPGFGQGVSAGDFDNDGFTDLYVANIGRNRLFRNNGDGTFQDVTANCPTGEDAWTTSCMIADLNEDGLPDLYDANYLSGTEAFETICGREHPRTCSPASFDGTLQRISVNSGDGTWRDVTSDSGLDRFRGKSLGVVATRLYESETPQLFVANDGVANFLFRNVAEKLGADPVYDELAIHSGVAFDRDGLAQACMGIAVEDIDADGRLDFFVTNFYEESNTLYVQKPGHLFADETRQAGLRNPSLLKLGFGTQFLDADLDGLPDLVVANGHVDDFSYDGKAFRMPPQFFRNVGAGRFEEQFFEQPGSYFAGNYLGRGLARLDWNRDGREDFAVSHLDGPSALVSNDFVGVGHSVTIRLIGTRCARDAIGTSVTQEFGSGGQRQYRQLTAGDGYQASNEKLLVLGLGAQNSSGKITIRWPSGVEQHLGELRAGFEYLLIEGRTAHYATPFEPTTGE